MSRQRLSGGARRLTVVIPACETTGLEDTLVSVLEHRPDGCEVVVALSTPYDDPWNIRDEVSFVDVAPAGGLVGCVNAGVAVAAGDVVHVLAAGWRATPGWADAAMRHFARSSVAAVVPLAVSDDADHRPIAAGVRRTSGGRCATVVPRPTAHGLAVDPLPSAPLLEAGFWAADIVREVGFAAACGDALAAADMAAALTAARADIVLEPESRVVSGPQRGRRSSFQEGRSAERLFWRSLACERPAAALVAHAGEVVRHAVATAPLGTLGMLAGRLAALLEFGASFSRTRQLTTLMRLAAERDTDGEALDTVRIDGPHDAPKPHLTRPVRELRRSA
ncbi:MAG: hypothetical protein ACKO4T_13200 [Planctomycetaceae bacterium]